MRGRTRTPHSQREAFVDTHFWVALTLAGVPWHEKAVALQDLFADAIMVTPDAVLVEFLNFVSEYGHIRTEMADFLLALVANPQVTVVPCSGEVFNAGLELYRRRPDKGYSLTDCFSMIAMRARGLTEILTHDHHFTQEGFHVRLV